MFNVCGPVPRHTAKEEEKVNRVTFPFDISDLNTRERGCRVLTTLHLQILLRMPQFKIPLFCLHIRCKRGEDRLGWDATLEHL